MLDGSLLGMKHRHIDGVGHGMVLLHASGASARSASAPTDNGTPSATAIRSCHSELDAGYPTDRPQRAGNPALTHLRMLVARQGWACGAGLGRRIVWERAVQRLPWP